MVSSFKRRGPGQSSSEPHAPIGTRASSHAPVYNTSSGIENLDSILGGGLPVGSVLTVCETSSKLAHSRAFVDYFIANGLHVGHHQVLASGLLRNSETKAISTIPRAGPVHSIIPNGSDDDDDGPNSKDDLTIAWRYKDLAISEKKKSVSFGGSGPSKGDSSSSNEASKTLYCGRFDTTKTLDSCPSNVTFIDATKIVLEPESTQRVLSEVKDTIAKAMSTKSVARIAMHCVASPLFEFDAQGTHRLLITLDLIVQQIRVSPAVLLLTLAKDFLPTSLVRRVIHVSDSVLTLDPFSGCGLSPMEKHFPEHHGILRIEGIPRVNSVPSPVSLANGSVFVYRLRRKKMVIEVLNLPPETGDGDDGEPVSRFNSANTRRQLGKSGQSNCSSGHQHGLDF